MSNERTCIQMVTTYTRRGAADPSLLERAVEDVLEALARDATFVAWGPSVAVDFASNSIEVECTIDEAHAARSVERVNEVVRQTLAVCEYDTESLLRPVSV